MSTVGDFTVSAEAFALAETLPAVPEIVVEFDRIVTHSREWIMPFLWVTAPEEGFDQFDAALETDPSVEDATVTDSFPDSRLYKMQWCRDVARTVDTILDHEGTILEASGQGDTWNLKVRFADRDQLTTFHDHFSEGGSVELEALFSPSEPYGGTFGLTPKQRDALLAAYEAGYYESPRKTTASELAAEFGVSQQAFSERLQRGTAAFIENALMTGESGAGT